MGQRLVTPSGPHFGALTTSKRAPRAIRLSVELVWGMGMGTPRAGPGWGMGVAGGARGGARRSPKRVWGLALEEAGAGYGEGPSGACRGPGVGAGMEPGGELGVRARRAPANGKMGAMAAQRGAWGHGAG